MAPAPGNADNWVEELVQFLRRQPGVSALRLDPAAHKVSVATVGQVDLADFEARLAATITAIEAKLQDPATGRVGSGFSLHRDGAAVVLERDSCQTAETL